MRDGSEADVSSNKVNALQTTLALYRARLSELDVIEVAESTVRERHHEMRRRELAQALVDVDLATEEATDARSGTDLVAIMEAEQRLCAAQHAADTRLRVHIASSRRGEQAQAAYATARLEVIQRVKTVQMVLARQRLSGCEPDEPDVGPYHD